MNNLPIVIHSQCGPDTYSVIRQYGKGSEVLIHCFSQSVEMMRRYGNGSLYCSWRCIDLQMRLLEVARVPWTDFDRNGLSVFDTCSVSGQTQ